MSKGEHDAAAPSDLKELAGRPVQAPELIGAALSDDPTYRRLVNIRLRRELMLHGPDRPRAILKQVLEELGGALTERSKKLRALFATEPLLLALLPGAARPPVFASPDGWRRREPRIPVNWEMECIVADDEVMVKCRVLDVSSRGAFFTCSRNELYRFSTGDPIVLRMPDAVARMVAPLEMHGAVRWIGFSITHQDRGVGVEFTQAIPGLDAWLKG